MQRCLHGTAVCVCVGVFVFVRVEVPCAFSWHLQVILYNIYLVCWMNKCHRVLIITTAITKLQLHIIFQVCNLDILYVVTPLICKRIYMKIYAFSLLFFSCCFACCSIFWIWLCLSRFNFFHCFSFFFCFFHLVFDFTFCMAVGIVVPWWK